MEYHEISDREEKKTNFQQIHFVCVLNNERIDNYIRISN